jgi:twitching motility protein PilI
MPVLDMNGFLYGKPTEIRKESRILIINKLGIVAGLLVDEVYGLRRFKHDEHQKQVKEDAGAVGEYLAGTFADQVRRWNVFSVERLASAEQFLRVV